MAESLRRVYETAHLSPGEQFAYWRESICEAFAALDPVADAGARASFASLVEVDALPGASLSLVRSQPQRVVRAGAQIRRDPRDRLFLNVMLDGESLVEQDGQRARVAAGGCFVVDSARPYMLEHPAPFRLLCLDVPRTALPGAAPARAASVREGRPRLAMGLLRELRDADGGLDAAARDEALRIACGWLAPALAAAPAGAGTAALGLADTHRRALRLIDERLREPGLAPGAIAADLRVSLRYLHKAFAQHGETVAATIRTRRLERCAGELARAAGARTVAAIAQDWGFADAPHFHRCFRARFGVTPGAFRLGRRA